MSLFGRFFGEASQQEPQPEIQQEVPASLEGEVKGNIEEGKIEKRQLLQILDKIKEDPKIYPEIIEQLAERNKKKFQTKKEVKEYIDSATTSAKALGVANLIDRTLGTGTFRTLSFLDKGQDSARSVFRLLKNSIERTSFEKQVEKGHYLNLLESYGVQWTPDKISRDCLQNFFDAAGHTLDGIDIETKIEGRTERKGGKEIKTAEVTIRAPQDYDWRELIHFGGTTKQDSETDVGGFGEGLKISAFALLRDQGAKQVKAASRDWELDYYFADVPEDAYRKESKGLFAKKHTREKQPGNYLSIVFEGDDADEKAKAFGHAREFFFSSENPDFQGASFNNPESGGFKILPLAGEYNSHQDGHLYIAGQRNHYNNREKWETVGDLNVWTWKKIQPKDRDRGMLTRDEMKDLVLPLIVDSMSVVEAEKSVYDFKPLWDKLYSFSVSADLLEKIVEKLENAGRKLEFTEEYLANDIPFGPYWISTALKEQGFKTCMGYMKKIGMKGIIDKFKELQSHYRMEEAPGEKKRIELLKELAQKIGLPEDEVKDVWVFSEHGEKNIFSGQYNSEFYWMSREELKKNLLDVLHTYVHEAAHKKGPHGQAEFEYYLQEQIKKIHQFTLDHKPDWDAFEQQWNAAT